MTTDDQAAIKARIRAQLADTRAHATAVTSHLERATDALTRIMTAAERVQVSYPDIARDGARCVRDAVVALSVHADAIHELAQRSTKLLEQLGEASGDGR